MNDWDFTRGMATNSSMDFIGIGGGGQGHGNQSGSGMPSAPSPFSTPSMPHSGAGGVWKGGYGGMPIMDAAATGQFLQPGMHRAASNRGMPLVHPHQSAASTGKITREMHGNGADPGAGRREKHKLVEQRRREKTKDLLVEIQELLPRPAASDKNATMNIILAETVEFLKQLQLQEGGMAGKATGSAADGVSNGSKDGSPVGLASEEYGRTLLPDPVFALRAGFMAQMQGLAFASIDGRFLDCNKAFCELLGFGNPAEVIGNTFFSFTSPEDMQAMMSATSKLLSGESDSHTMVKRCILKGGSAATFRVKMQLLRRRGSPHCFMCEVIPATDVNDSEVEGDACQLGLPFRDEENQNHDSETAGAMMERNGEGDVMATSLGQDISTHEL